MWMSVLPVCPSVPHLNTRSPERTLDGIRSLELELGMVVGAGNQTQIPLGTRAPSC